MLPSGVYFYRLQVRPLVDGQEGSFVETKKFCVVK
jgi:hypothetical protein